MITKKKQRSFSITLRPRLGLHGRLADEIVEWFNKKEFHAYVFELTGEKRHIHGQIWLEEATSIDSIRKALFRIMKSHLEPQGEWTKACQSVQSEGFRYAYNDDWATKYIVKDGPHVEANIPEDTTPYYPTLEQQAAFIASAVRTSDPYYHALKDRWETANPNYIEHQFTIVDVGKFYYSQMFIDKMIAVIADTRQSKQKASALFHYIFPNVESLDRVVTRETIDMYNLLKEI